jgi:ferritin-like protein
MLQVLVQAERCATRTYTETSNMTFGRNHRMHEVALAILHEEVEHEAWFSEYLGEGPSGHFRRSARGASSYVLRFMSADIA